MKILTLALILFLINCSMPKPKLEYEKRFSNGPIYRIAISEDNEYYAIYTLNDKKEPTILFYHKTTNNVFWNLRVRKESPIVFMHYIKNHLIAIRYNGEITIFNIPQKTFKTYSDMEYFKSVTSVYYINTNQKMILGYRDGVVKIYDVTKLMKLLQEKLLRN